MIDLTSSNYTAKPLTVEDFTETMNMIKNLPPVPIEIHMSPKCFYLVEKNFVTTTEIDLIHGHASTIYGVKVLKANDSDGIAANQAKVIYSDGSSKIIDIYKSQEVTNANKRAD